MHSNYCYPIIIQRLYYLYLITHSGGVSGKESACQYRGIEMRFQSLGRRDPLEKGMAAHSGILVWRIPLTEGPVPSVAKSQTWLKPLSTQSAHSVEQKCSKNYVHLNWTTFTPEHFFFFCILSLFLSLSLLFGLSK